MLEPKTQSNTSSRLQTLLQRVFSSKHVEIRFSVTDTVIAAATPAFLGLLGWFARAPWVLWLPMGFIVAYAIIHLRHSLPVEGTDASGSNLKTALKVCVVALLVNAIGCVYWYYRDSAPKVRTELEEKLQLRTEDRDDAIEAKRIALKQLHEREAELGQEATLQEARIQRLKEQNDELSARIATEAQSNLLKNKMSQWLNRLEEFQNSLSNENPRTQEDWASFRLEFTEFAKQELPPWQFELLNTTAGMPQYFTARNLEGDQLVMYKALRIAIHRLEQFLTASDSN